MRPCASTISAIPAPGSEAFRICQRYGLSGDDAGQPVLCQRFGWIGARVRLNSLRAWVGWAICPPPICLGLKEVEIVKRDDRDQRDAQEPSYDTLHLKLHMFAFWQWDLWIQRRADAGGRCYQGSGLRVRTAPPLGGGKRSSGAFSGSNACERLRGLDKAKRPPRAPPRPGIKARTRRRSAPHCAAAVCLQTARGDLPPGGRFATGASRTAVGGVER
jgi:hypothetical protein